MLRTLGRRLKIGQKGLCRALVAPLSSAPPTSGGHRFTKNAATELQSSYDVVVVGAGHNGLISAAYLQKAGLKVAVLEKRHVVGGAAVTEEIVPGFKFSRASYVLSLLRPWIIRDLKLKDFGLRFHLREPFSSYTPISEKFWGSVPARSLLLGGPSMAATQAEIAKFSKKDATSYAEYEKLMGRFVAAVVTLLESPPPRVSSKTGFLSKLASLRPLLRAGRSLELSDLPRLHQLLTAPASVVLDSWFESEPLKATLATDALIGTYSGPHTPGTGYVLLHHIMGGVDDQPGAWAYAEGGMGAVSDSIAASAAALGVDIFTEQEVERIDYKLGASEGGSAVGVVLKDGRKVAARKAVLSNATPEVTFKKLTPVGEALPLFGEEFISAVNRIDYTSPVTKINVAVSRLPNFVADPGPLGVVGAPHKCTIHLNCESMAALESSYSGSVRTGKPSTTPMIEMVIPSSLDATLTTSPGAHVVLLFTQYTPITPSDGRWEDPGYKEKYWEAVADTVEGYAPGFKASVVGKEVLTPWDLEETFGLTGGNIFHGGMGMERLYWLRPFYTEEATFPGTGVKGLWLCGSGAHPGGGVMGLPGYFAAKAVLESRQ